MYQNFLLSIIGMLLVFSQCGYCLDIHVAPGGDDANPGSEIKPLKTLIGARDAVRKINQKMNGDIVIHLRGGMYGMTQSADFAAQDSGFNGHKIIYRAFRNEKPVLSGGIRITNWKLHNKEMNIFSAAAPKDPFRQLYIDGERAIRARTPNRDSATDFGPYWELAVPRIPVCSITKQNWAACAGVTRLNEVELVINSHWYQQRIRIGDYTAAGDRISVSPCNPKGKMTKPPPFYAKSRFFFENALEFIDSANEWYHEPGSGTLYLAVAQGRLPGQLEIEIPVNSTLITVQGTAEEPVHDLEFQGITLQCSNWSSPSINGLNVTQFVQPVDVPRTWETPDCPPGIIRVAYARKIAFRHNTIRNTGAHGIQFFVDVDDSDIEGNEIYNIAANGIEIDTHAARNPAPDKQSTGVAIWNNHIRQCGQDYTNGGGLLAHNVRGLIVEHNLIHDMPYSGMQIGNQPDKGFQNLGCGDNRIRINHIHHCMQLHDDGGGIYTLGGIQEGSVISENYVHDIKVSKWAGRYPIDLIYLDNRTSKILVKDNVVNGGKAAERNGSKGNTLLNNTQSNPVIEKNAGIKAGYDPRAK